MINWSITEKGSQFKARINDSGVSLVYRQNATESTLRGKLAEISLLSMPHLTTLTFVTESESSLSFAVNDLNTAHQAIIQFGSDYCDVMNQKFTVIERDNNDFFEICMCF